MAITSDLDDGIENLRAVGLSNREIRVWVIAEVVDYNANPNPHPMTIDGLNNFLTPRGLLPALTGNPNDIVKEPVAP